MKSYLRSAALALAVVAVFATVAWAAMRVYDNVTLVSVIPADVRAATYTTNDIDIRPYKGQGMLVLDAEATGGAGVTDTVVVQTSNLANGSSVTTAGSANHSLNLNTVGMTKIGALFAQSATRQVKHVDLIMKANGTVAASNIILTIEDDDAGAPNGTALTTAVAVDGSGIDDANQPVRFTLTTPYQLTAAANYWIVLTSDYAASDANFLDWSATTSLAGNSASYNGSSWAATNTKNLRYTVKQYNFTAAVNFAAVNNTAVRQSAGIELDSVGAALRAVSTVAGGASNGAKSLILIAPNN